MIRCALLAALGLAMCLCAPSLASAQDINYRFPGSDDHQMHYYVTAYRDLTGSGGGLQDWGCGTKTYDGHRGTDLGVGGFAGMDAGRDVVAAADGVVDFVSDGFFDRCTTGNCAGGGGFGNYVRVAHSDGKVTYYGHLRNGSITVGVGNAVTCGQKLGQVGSSGSSTGPHLHFEPRLNQVSDDPFGGGGCGGSSSWWVDQGEYLSLPQTLCHNAPKQHPLLSIDANIEPIEGQAADLYPAGESAGIFDLEAQQSVTVRFDISDADSAIVARNVIVGLESIGGLVEITGWQILDNWAGNACGGEFCPNDANDNPLNPPRDRPGDALELHLNALSPGETKRIELTLRYLSANNGQGPHASVQLWLKEVEGSYAKPSFDAPPDNVDDFQTFNDGDLRQKLLLDTWNGDGGDEDEMEEKNSDEGGCSTSQNTGGSAAAFAFFLLLAWNRRRAHAPK